MKRIAWFTPLPPVRSGIARYSVELLSRLGHHYEIDVFVDTAERQAPSGVASVFSAHDFVWKHAVDPYALIVYQLGNAPCHDYMWPYLVRFRASSRCMMASCTTPERAACWKRIGRNTTGRSSATTIPTSIPA